MPTGDLEKAYSEGRARAAAMGEALSSVEGIWPDAPSVEVIIEAVCEQCGSTAERLFDYRYRHGLRPEHYQRTAVMVLALEYHPDMGFSDAAKIFPPEMDTRPCLAAESLNYYYSSPQGAERKDAGPLVEAVRQRFGDSSRFRKF